MGGGGGDAGCWIDRKGVGVAGDFAFVAADGLPADDGVADRFQLRDDGVGDFGTDGERFAGLGVDAGGEDAVGGVGVVVDEVDQELGGNGDDFGSAGETAGEAGFRRRGIGVRGEGDRGRGR